MIVKTTPTIQVERIRELAMEKSTGKISDDEFLAKKRQLLEMEHLRREADEETRRRAQVSIAYRLTQQFVLDFKPVLFGWSSLQTNHSAMNTLSARINCRQLSPLAYSAIEAVLVSRTAC